ncbi:MAG: DUF3592 domain-containing protein [Ferruginibacter sp.]
MRKYSYPIIYFVGIVGLLLIVCSIYFFSKTWLFKSKAHKTTGRIIDVQSRLGGKYKVQEYAAVIAFKTADGTELKFQSQDFTISKPVIGKSIKLYYTLDPLHAEEEKFTALWAVPLGLLILGSAFILFCLLYYKKIHL